jgi:hypothetical protein
MMTDEDFRQTNERGAMANLKRMTDWYGYIRNVPAHLLWRFRNRDGRFVECWVEFAPNGVEVSILSDGRRLLSRVLSSGTEATAWAEEEHEAWMQDDQAL